MQITVKSRRMIKEGERDGGGHYKWCSVMAEDGSQKGKEYTTFDASVMNLGPGSIIDIGDPVEKQEEYQGSTVTKYSFKKIVSVISEVTAAVAPAPAPNGVSDMSKDEWKEKQRIERASFEAQTAYKGIVDIAQAYVAAGVDLSDAGTFSEHYNLAMAWAKGRILNNGIPGRDLASLPVPRPDSVPSTAPITPQEEAELLFPNFKNIGELFAACLKINVSRAEALKKIGAREGDDLSKVNLAEAWSVITANGAAAKNGK